jgi:hypothetical protein
MKHVQAYVDSKNKWNAIFGSKQYDLAVAADRQLLAQCIDSELSPENLTCDGEIRGAQLQKKYRALITVAQELKAFDPTVTFQEI